MYMNSSNMNSCNYLHIGNLQSLKRHKARRCRRLSSYRWRRALKEEKEKKMRATKTEMKMKNLKLYTENKSILEENKKLRKIALLLQQENQALLSRLQNKCVERL
ncbi:hypothetical protein K2173_024139 [Erythroxylum novogranatense]|uniref:BZIP domain-containing protein n=1 Tax=Erythroxylum novogranatense TaxID=1862640 RepID=A0AAV8UBS6_9ROSI|nr:hypothetical protein K2173_024139 [Erythroxylum novogranatense]